MTDQKPLTLKGRVGIAAFFALFLAAGLGFLTPVFILPAARMVRAASWQATTCTDVRATLHESSDSEGGSSYRIDVAYRYEFDGQSYAGNRYRFSILSTGGSRRKSARVAELNRAGQVACYVNPENPAESVIDRTPTADMWFAIIPLIFVLVGAGGVYAAFRMSSQPGPMTLRAPRRVSVQLQAPAAAGPGPLRPKLGRRATAFAVFFFAIFWNGIVSVFLYQVVSQWSRGGGFQWFLALFLVPFVLIGLLLIGTFIHKALALFNPEFTLAVTSSRVALGEELAIEWSSAGDVGKLRRFSIDLEGREQATYQRGTDTKTATRTFATRQIVQQLVPEISGAGRAKVVIPADSMHTFEARNNKVTWVLRVRGEVPSWPDTDDEFPLTVGPRR